MPTTDFKALLCLDQRKPDGLWLKAFLDLVHSSMPVAQKTLDTKSSELKSLIQVLSKHPDLLLSLQKGLWDFLEAHPARTLLGRSDLNLEGSLINSLCARLLGKFLPPAPRVGYLPDQLLLAITTTEWLSQIDPQDLSDLCTLLSPNSDCPAFRSLVNEVWGALDIVTHQLSAQGIDSELVRYSWDGIKHANPFLEQARELGRMLDSSAVNDEQLLVLLNQCEEQLKGIRRRAFRQGTSTQLTYILVSAQQSIERIRLLLDLAQGRMTGLHQAEFWLRLARAETRRNSIWDLSEQHFRVMLWKITVHAGETGHHYIAETPRQLKGLFKAAAGAGCITAGLALIKISISEVHLSIFFEALFFGLNYGLGFVLIHLCGFTIATKQPAMTAAALANTLSEDWHSKGQPNVRAVADKCWHTIRSQMVAIAGNVLLAFPVAYLLSWIWSQKFGAPPASAEKAAHMLHDLDPIHSLALFHAAIAGVGLFMAGLVSGFFDNLSAYFDVPGRLRHTAWLGRHAEAWANYASSESGASAGNLCLGFYLGGMGGLGQIIGLPLDIRHVAFASANLGLTLASIIPQPNQLLLAIVGILLIGIVNLAVSFGLAVTLALMARGLGWPAVRLLLLHFSRRLRRNRHSESPKESHQSIPVPPEAG